MSRTNILFRVLMVSSLHKVFSRVPRVSPNKKQTFLFHSRRTYCSMSGSGEVKANVVQTQDWVKRWDDRQIGFHKDHVNELLLKHASTLVNGRSNLKIFIPLCGKSLDIKWLADQGHTVVGVEAARKAIEEFSEEQKIPFTTKAVPAVDGMLFQSEDKRVNIYCCDFYNFSREMEGQFDAIWDRGSLVAINLEDRQKYAALLKTLMAPGCRYLISALQYDETKYGGPPHHLSDEAIHALFDDSCDVKEIDDNDAFEERHSRWGIDWMREKVFLITPKQ